MKTKKMLIALMTTTALCGGIGAICPHCQGKDCEPKAVAAFTLTAEDDAKEQTQTALVVENTPQITAKAGFLLEANSGEVLFAHNADQRLPIASMTKVATLGVIYDALDKGMITMDEMVLVSDFAASMGGSQAFLDAGSEYSVRDLIQSIVVASANDSCVAMAERLYGSVESFVTQMNQFAKDLGCQNTNFVNCTGLPTPGAYSCARDMSKMYAKIMQSPHYGDFNKVWMYDLTHPSGRITGLTNTNKLIRSFNGCLGGKTGFTNEAGHCITVAAQREDLQPIAVIIGASDSKTRFAESASLLNFAFNSFENKLVVDKTVPVKQVAVKNAVAEQVNLYPAENFYKLTQKGTESNLTIGSDLPNSITAPTQAHDTVGQIYVMQDSKVIKEIPVQTNTDIPAASYLETIQKLVGQAQL